MKKAEVRKYEDKLLAKQASLSDRLQRLTSDIRRAKGALNADFAEQAVELENNEVVDKIDDATRLELANIALALEKIAAGTYGTCSKCGEPIAAKRLEALPETPHCTGCAI